MKTIFKIIMIFFGTYCVLPIMASDKFAQTSEDITALQSAGKFTTIDLRQEEVVVGNKDGDLKKSMDSSNQSERDLKTAAAFPLTERYKMPLNGKLATIANEMNRVKNSIIEIDNAIDADLKGANSKEISDDEARKLEEILKRNVLISAIEERNIENIELILNERLPNDRKAKLTFLTEAFAVAYDGDYEQAAIPIWKKLLADYEEVEVIKRILAYSFNSVCIVNSLVDAPYIIKHILKYLRDSRGSKKLNKIAALSLMLSQEPDSQLRRTADIQVKNMDEVTADSLERAEIAKIVRFGANKLYLTGVFDIAELEPRMDEAAVLVISAIQIFYDYENR